MKYYIIAGEPSGDLHAAALVHELKKLDKNSQFHAWGGDLLKKEGVELIKHYRETAFMGFLTVFLNLRTIFKNIRFCKQDLIKRKPDVLVLIDYPGFNLKIARFAKNNGIKVFYYISPKIWAWKKWRINTIKKYVDKMYVILPFEEKFYKKYDYKVHYVGNPLVDAVNNRPNKNESLNTFSDRFNLSGKPIVALLPGSRKQEIISMLPIMTTVAKQFPDYEFVISGMSHFSKDFYFHYSNKISFPILFDNTYTLLQQANAAIVASGTATLETALLNIPQLVLYRQKGGIIVAKVARIVYPHFFSLVNLIAGKEVVKELFMNQVTVKNVAKEMERLLNNKAYRQKMLSDYKQMQKLLGQNNAALRAANLMVKHLSKK